ncbi:MAG: hypothetical protein O3A46_14600 [Candidatus Poribacteria bacterium]|nr:hypothetical protein [Candidatus Poribacteria bacterium]
MIETSNLSPHTIPAVETQRYDFERLLSVLSDPRALPRIGRESDLLESASELLDALEQWDSALIRAADALPEALWKYCDDMLAAAIAAAVSIIDKTLPLADGHPELRETAFEIERRVRGWKAALNPTDDWVDSPVFLALVEEARDDDLRGESLEGGFAPPLL